MNSIKQLLLLNKEKIKYLFISKLIMKNQSIRRIILYSIPAVFYVYALFYYFNHVAKKPNVYFNRSNRRMQLLYQSLSDILESKYYPTFWASNRHLNTIIGSFIRRNPPLKFKRYISLLFNLP